MKTKVAVGLSGGVDSAVSAALLKQAGFEVVGVYLHCFPAVFQKTLACTDKEDFKMAQAVAKSLGIPFTFFDFEKEYQAKVIEYFFKEYQVGRTPNPDAVCNKEIKFGLFLKKAIQEMGMDFVATGHYARIGIGDGDGSCRSAAPRVAHSANKPGAPAWGAPPRVTRRLDMGDFMTESPAPATPRLAPNDELLPPKPYTLNPNYYLLAGVDSTKDQSYFLYNLSQEQLSRILFPVGEYTKKEVRQMARDFGLPNWQKKDSQGICFLGKVSVRKFLEQRIKPKKGEVADTEGRVIGEHDGVWFYTIGQRHGFRVSRSFKSLTATGPAELHPHPTSSLTLRALDGGPPRSSPVVTFYPSFNGPWYVVEKDIENNRLIVGWGKECEKKEFLVEKVNWINHLVLAGPAARHLAGARSANPPTGGLRASKVYPRPELGSKAGSRHPRPDSKPLLVEVRIRHLGELYPCQLITHNPELITVRLSEPAWGVASGQAAVFYSEEEVLGGGIIK